MTGVHDVLVAAHATAAVLAAVSGVVAFATARLLAVHLLCTAAMTVSLAGAVVVGWAGLGSVTRVVFTFLVVLAAAMTVTAGRAWTAGRSRPVRRPDRHVVDRVGFVLVSLAVGLVAVAVLRVGASTAVVVAASVGTVLLTRALVGVLGRRVLARAGS